MNLAVDVNFLNVFCACWACPEFFLVTFVKVMCAVSYEGLWVLVGILAKSAEIP